MRYLLGCLLIAILALGSLGALVWPQPAKPVQIAKTQVNVKRGAYLARISGCVACHTDTARNGEPLAGGVGLDTEFGIFHAPNITPDAEFGVGGWSLEDFARALRHGIAPDGGPYYPAFPYPFYASLNDRDISDLWAALQLVPPADVPSKPHELRFPYNLRQGLIVWRAFFMEPQASVNDPDRSAAWNRGKFIVEGPAHCGACHTPRNLAGARILEQAYAGDPEMLDGGTSPAITADALREKGWTKEDIVKALRTGVLPDGDVFGGSMAEVVRDGTAYMLPLHLDDIATFLLDES